MSKEKRLSIKLVGHDYVTAFKNKDKENDNQPDYKGDGVAIWIHEYEPKSKDESLEIKEEKVL